MSDPLAALSRARARAAGFLVERPDLEDLPPVDEIIQRRSAEFERRAASHAAEQLLTVRIALDGPVGILHFGDPHIDDDGCDIRLLTQHVELVQRTEGLFGGNVGDLQNNWVGRLAHLYSQQSTSAREGWKLTEWLVQAVPWLYLIKGNHDCWTGDGDPLDWMMQHQPGVLRAWGARLNLVFPSGRAVRLNARHDFHGNSMWNTAHGPGKAVQMGWRDHILTCGHKHTSGYQTLKDPATGLISHAIRVASYKVIDGYATKLGLPNQNISPAVLTVIDPSKADDHPGLVTVFWDPATGADFLTWLRRRGG